MQSAVLAKAFSSAGADLSVVTANLEEGQPMPYPAFNAFFSNEGLPGVRFLHPRMTGLLRALERADADVYFQHCAGWVTGLTSWFCKRNRRIFVYFAGSDSDFSYRDAIIEGVRDKLLYFWGAKNASGLVVQNEYQARLCRDRLKREPRIIPTAVEPVRGEETARDGTVVWAGGLRAVKRPGLFLELARRLPDLRFVLLGGELPTEPGFGREIRESAKKLPNVDAPGFVSSDEVDGYFSRAALLVNTSSFEGFPNAFLEAWARRTPVVSFVDVDGIIERHGVGVVAADFDEMTDCVRDIAQNEEKRRIMGERARQLIDTTYSSDTTARQHMAYFEELIRR